MSYLQLIKQLISKQRISPAGDLSLKKEIANSKSDISDKSDKRVSVLLTKEEMTMKQNFEALYKNILPHYWKTIPKDQWPVWKQKEEVTHP